MGEVSPKEQDRLWRAWEHTGCQGLGRDRTPFFLDEVRPLAWEGTTLSPGRLHPGFGLWPLGDLDPRRPCNLRVWGLRMFYQRQFVREPNFVDLTMATLRRAEAFLPPEAASRLKADQAAWLEIARRHPAGAFRGQPQSFARYSGSQKRRLELPTITGDLPLPQGPGPLAPLFAAAEWLHLGKSTVFGLGRLMREWPD